MADASPPSLLTLPPVEVEGHRLTVLPDGPQRFEELIRLIDGAQESLRLLYYMFLDDESGLHIRNSLLAAVERGVAVTLLIDGFGSDGARSDFFDCLAESDARFCRFEPRFGRRYLLRNHQKLAMADEKLVLVGGFNIGDDYFGSVKGGAWRDIGLKVEGPGLQCLADYFDALFAWAKDPHSKIRGLRRILSTHSTSHGDLHWLFGGPTRRLSPWARSVKKDMEQASRLDMIAAYFAPSRGMLRRISAVAKRGGRARIITAAKSDNSATIGAARHNYWRLLKRGVEIYEYQPTKLHSKLFVVDDVVHIGSANFDMRSLYLNLEMMLRVQDPHFARQMRKLVEHEIAHSEAITKETFAKRRTPFNRVVWGLSHFLVATLDYNITDRLNFGLSGR